MEGLKSVYAAKLGGKDILEKVSKRPSVVFFNELGTLKGFKSRVTLTPDCMSKLAHRTRCPLSWDLKWRQSSHTY